MINRAVHPPDRQLCGYIDSYVCLSSDQWIDHQILPADCASLWVVVRGQATLDCGPETRKAIWPATLTGPFHRHHKLGMIGPAMLFGARLTPAGWGGLIPQDAHRLTDKAKNAALFLGPSIEQLHISIAKCAKLNEMAELANQFFAARIKAIPMSHQRVNRALTDWLASAPRPRPDMVSRQLNMSARQVERIANRYWGAPPRTLDRVNRAQRAAASLCAGNDAVEAFSDASHMIREVKRVTGHTPRQLQSLRRNPDHRLHPPKIRDCNSD